MATMDDSADTLKIFSSETVWPNGLPVISEHGKGVVLEVLVLSLSTSPLQWSTASEAINMAARNSAENLARGLCMEKIN